MTLNGLTSWLLGFGTTFLAWLSNLAIDTINALINAISTAAISVVSLFPAASSTPSPLAMPATSPTLSAFINGLNWFFPIGYLVTVVTFVAGTIVSYFIIAPLARWFKVLT